MEAATGANAAIPEMITVIKRWVGFTLRCFLAVIPAVFRSPALADGYIAQSPEWFGRLTDVSLHLEVRHEVLVMRGNTGVRKRAARQPRRLDAATV